MAPRMLKRWTRVLHSEDNTPHVASFVVKQLRFRPINTKAENKNGNCRQQVLTLKASPSLTILAQNSENSEVQNLLEPQSDSGVPGGPSQPTPDNQPAAGGQMQVQPEGGGVGETNAIDQEEGK